MQNTRDKKNCLSSNPFKNEIEHRDVPVKNNFQLLVLVSRARESASLSFISTNKPTTTTTTTSFICMTVNLLQYCKCVQRIKVIKKKDIYKINYTDSILLRESKQDKINLINCMFTKKMEEFINSKIKSDTGSRIKHFGWKVVFSCKSYLSLLRIWNNKRENEFHLRFDYNHRLGNAYCLWAYRYICPVRSLVYDY